MTHESVKRRKIQFINIIQCSNFFLQDLQPGKDVLVNISFLFFFVLWFVFFFFVFFYIVVTEQLRFQI